MTLFERLYYFRLDKIPLHRRQKLGMIVSKDFFSQTEYKKHYTRKQREGRDVFEVIVYDHRYTPRMDELIMAFCEKYRFELNPRPIQKSRQNNKPIVSRETNGKRKRIPARKPEWSSKNNKP